MSTAKRPIHNFARAARPARPGALWAGLLWFFAAVSGAGAHPLSQGALEVVILPDRVAVTARVTLEEVSVTNMLVPPPAEISGAPAVSAAESTPTGAATSGAAASGETASGETAADPMAAEYERHARYLAAHLHVSADGRPLTGRVVRVAPAGGAARPPAPQQLAVTYELEYRPRAYSDDARPAGGTPTTPGTIELRHDVLSDASFLPGIRWEATYVVRIVQPGGPSGEGLLLTSDRPITFACDPSPRVQAGDGAGVEAAAPLGSHVDRRRLLGDYFGHGVHHILGGYDHLLFISALVLAATRLRDLVKVVTAFTLAHTITLTLAALDLVRLPGWVVEPLIAASIVFVAVQNVFWPEHSRGWGRLAAAFFFGLFHGLGFAGGLLDAMQGMRGSTVLLAIAAFSVGVELGHQLIVFPLFGALTLARHVRTDGPARERMSLRAQRYGSALISLAGMFYLVAALRVSFGAGAGP